MSRLYEKFILNYFRKEHPEIRSHALQIPWQIDDGIDFLLPKMQTDVTLEYENRILIIDAKYYGRNLSKNYGKDIHHSKQLKKLKPSETYINITGIRYYQGFEPFKEGTVVDLIREPDNPHDCNAIRVEISGETVGYVANSRYTLIKEVKSATDIKNSGSTQAEVQFVLFNEWIIAKLI